MELSRNKMHEKALVIIYECLSFESRNVEYDIKEVISSTMEQPFDDVDIYIRQVVVSAILHREQAIEAITPNLKNWKFNRLSLLMQSILFLAYAQFYYTKDIDRAIIINTAVNLAKNYLDVDDYKFVNAILENTLK